MKKFGCALLCAVAALFVTGCSNSLERHAEISGELGSVSVNNNSDKAVFTADITKCNVSVTGYGISEPITNSATVSGGKGSLSVDKIPVGKNRIVTVQAFNEDEKINGVVMSAICDVSADKTTSVSVNWSTTALGNVFSSLLSSNYDISSIDSDEIDKIKNAIPKDKAPSLVNAKKIADDYKSGALSASSSYELKEAEITLNTTKLSGYKVYIGDPLSACQTISGDSSENTVKIAPGTWPVYAVKSDGKVQKMAYGTFSSGNTYKIDVTNIPAGTNLGVDLTGKTIVFVKSTNSVPKIWAWEDGGAELSVKLGEDWEHQPDMSAVTTEYMKEPSGWYMKDFSSVATGKTIKFKLNASDPEIAGKAGTFWYDGTSFSTTNPSPAVGSSTDDVVTITISGTGSGGGNNGGGNEGGGSGSTDSILVHAKYPYIHIWQSGVSSLDETTQPMVRGENGWYYYNIPATSAKMIFKQDTSWTGKTEDLSRDKAGKYWYYEGKWYESDPEDAVKPELTSFTSSSSGTVCGTVTLTANATDNKNLKNVTFTLSDGTVLGVVNVAGTSGIAEYSWDTTKVQNKTYTVKAVAYDAANNASDEKTLSLTTQNENLPPVAVISGSSRAKVDSSKTYNANSSYDQNGGTIASYSWSVSDGATILGGSTSESVTVKMPSGKTDVTISLQVTDNEGATSESVSKSVSVVEASSESVDFRDETIYFLMTTRFYDGDKNNNAYCWDDEECFKSVTLGDPGWRGDFKGLIEKLDYIKALGFSAVWITPVVENSSGLDYHGYHASNFEKVDPRYAGVGEDPMDAYQKLIDACHAKGIKVIQDIVLNHTSNFGENGFFRIFDTANKTRGSDGLTPAITVFADGSEKGVFEDAVYGLTSLKRALGSSDYWTLKGSSQYNMRIAAMKEDINDILRAYHHEKTIQWEGYTVQTGQMAGDCVDINTENHKVAEYIRNAYIKYINMGVDAFRIDTVKHISRLTFNKEFLPYFKQAGEDNGKDFFMFGEGCVLRNEVWNDNKPPISVPFYTWKGNDDSYSWSETDPELNEATVLKHYNDNLDVSAQPTSDNAFLNGNTYHAPDRSKSSGLDMIDFYMHHKFGSAGSAFDVASQEDRYFNDATYNVTYVDSHDYGPNEGGYLYTRFSGGTQAWASNLNLMFSFRGIPCVYYGTEIEFQKSKQIEPYTNGNKVPYAESGRAYFGDHLEGSVTATDYGEYSASGEVANTLNHELAQHIIRLNKIRRAIPALRKGQYSTKNCSGSIAFKRRYTDNDVDSFALVAINGGATFSGLPAGKYVEVITGKSVSVGEGGSITTDSIGEGNMRVYVNTSLNGCEVSGKIGIDGAYLK